MVNTAMVCFNTIMRQMPEMSQREKKPRTKVLRMKPEAYVEANGQCSVHCSLKHGVYLQLALLR